MNHVGRIIFMEVLRGYAILMIILVHSHQMFSLPCISSAILDFGMMGCQIFFLISGFFSLRDYGNKRDVLTYYKRKLIRIAPGYWLTIIIGAIVVALSILLFGVNKIGIHLSIDSIIPNFFLINGVVPGYANNNVVRGGWFIGTLIVLYILSPFISQLYKRINNCYLFLPFVAFIISSFFLLEVGYLCEDLVCYRNSFMYFSFINQMPVFILGMSLRVEYEKSCREKIGKNGIAYLLLGLFLLAISIFIFYLGFSSFEQYIYIFTCFIFSLSIYYISRYCLFLDKKYDSIFYRKIRKLGEAVRKHNVS